MYERNAIVIERYFNKMFGYDKKNNLKTNFQDYMELVDNLEKYKNISEEEETIMQEYDQIANKIREIQNNQEALNKRNEKYQEERALLFESIDENAEAIQKKLTNINNNIENINQEINENAQKYVNIIAEFNDKSAIRTTCERNKRKIEGDYNHKLNETLDNYQDIDSNYEKIAKKFLEETTEVIERELKEKIEKNGEKEKMPFDNNVIDKAINLSISIQKGETEILTYIYDKTNRLFVDIKNNATKCERYSKIIKDQKSKYEFLRAMQEYLIQFLDNERLTSVNGKTEHKKLMKEACKSFDEDFAQISNLYLLLQKEIAKKATKKNYSELYNVDYIKTLTKKAEEFDNEVKKLRISLTVINPNYWRIEGMQKIYDVFNQAVTQNYDRDLSEYLEVDTVSEDDEEDSDSNFEEDFMEDSVVEQQENKENDKVQDANKKIKKQEKVVDTRSEIDKKIDMILGFNEDGQLEDIEEIDEEWDDEPDKDKNTEDDDFEEDEYINDDWDEVDEDIEEDEEDSDYEDEDKSEFDDKENDDDYEDEDDFELDDKENDKENDEDWEDEIEEDDDSDDDEEINFDIWGNSINNKTKDKREEKRKMQGKEENEKKDLNNKLKSKGKKETNKSKEKENREEESWENEFINIDEKGKNKKKKSFFGKFKK